MPDPLSLSWRNAMTHLAGMTQEFSSSILIYLVLQDDVEKEFQPIPDHESGLDVVTHLIDYISADDLRSHPLGNAPIDGYHQLQ